MDSTNYDHYKIGRDAAWKALIDCGITSLPVDLWKIAGHYGLHIETYSKCAITSLMKESVLSGDGFSVEICGEKHIFMNDKKGTKERRRFTMAHELGHCIMGHPMDKIQYRNSEIDDENSPIELECNIFARDILMPATVLAALNIHTPEEIMDLCHISYDSARIRAERMEELYKRNMFNKHPLERKVREQFDPFIRDVLNK